MARTYENIVGENISLTLKVLTRFFVRPENLSDENRWRVDRQYAGYFNLCEWFESSILLHFLDKQGVKISNLVLTHIQRSTGDALQIDIYPRQTYCYYDNQMIYGKDICQDDMLVLKKHLERLFDSISALHQDYKVQIVLDTNFQDDPYSNLLVEAAMRSNLRVKFIRKRKFFFDQVVEVGEI